MFNKFAAILLCGLSTTLFTPETEYEFVNLPTETEIVEVSSQNTVTVMMAGDILLHTPVEEAALQTDGSYEL